MLRHLRKKVGGSKSSRDKEQASSAAADAASENLPRFRNSAAETKHARMLERLKLHEPRSLDPAVDYNFPIRELFHGTTLEFFLSLLVAFNPNFIMAWYANIYSAENRSIKSFLCGRDVEITTQDLSYYLGLSDEGEVLWPSFRNDTGFDWTQVNLVLRGTQSSGHIADTKHLTRDAYLTQYVLRHSMFPKSGDIQSVNITLSLATFFCQTKTPFDAAGALLAEMWSASHYVQSRQPKRLPYGHLITHILGEKYGMEVFAGFPPEYQMTYFQPRNIASVLKRFPVVGEHERDAAAEEADVAGVAEEHVRMEEDYPDHGAPRMEIPPSDYHQTPLFEHEPSPPYRQPPVFHHQAPEFDERRDPYFNILFDNQQVMRADQLAIREEQTRLREWHEVHMKAMADAEARAIARDEAVRNSLEEVRTSVEGVRQLTLQFGNWWSHQGPPPPSDQPPSDDDANARWGSWL